MGYGTLEISLVKVYNHVQIEIALVSNSRLLCHYGDTNIDEGSPTYGIGRPLSSICVSTFSNIFSSETSGPIKAKFHVEPPSDGGTKVSSNGPGHMSKVATMPIYMVKTFKKSSSPEPKGS